MAVDDTDDPISGEYQRAGETAFDRVHKDPATAKPGIYVNKGQRDPVHPGPKVGKKRRTKR
jgi:hypothetical protein